MSSPAANPDVKSSNNLSPSEYQSKFREGTFAPNPYADIQRRAQGLLANEDPLYEHNLVSPADKLIVDQINIWQRNFPSDISQLGSYATQTINALRTKYTKSFYFWTAYNTVRSHLENTAVGDDLAEKQSAKIQANAACPGARAAYAQCTDVFHSIDITTRLSLPIQHQVTCREPFVALEQCLEHHLRNWAKTMRSLKKLEDLPEYKQYYLKLESQATNDATPRVVSALDNKTTADTSDIAKKVHMTLWQYDPDFTTNRDVDIAETLFEVKRLFPDEYLNNSKFYDALKRPLTSEQQTEAEKLARANSIDYSNLQLDSILFNLQRTQSEQRVKKEEA